MTISRETLYSEVTQAITEAEAASKLIVSSYAWAWNVHAVRITPIFLTAEQSGLIKRAYSSTAGNIVWEKVS